MGLLSWLFRLKLFLQYLFLEDFPLLLGEDTGVILLTNFHSLICYLNYRATLTCITQSYNFHPLYLLTR